MKNKLLLLVLSFFLIKSSISQVSSNSFAQSAGTYTAITGGTVLWSTTFDEDISGAITIPSFSFNCTAYTQLFVSANGFISFGSAPSGSNYTPISGTETSGIVAAFAGDLANATAGIREVRYQDVAASNEFVIQWRDVCRFGITGERISFQIRLNYATNVIRIVYGGTITANAATTPTMQIGLRGLANTDFNNRTTTTNWSATTAGGTNAATCQFSGTIKPAVGQTYTFTPSAMSYVSCTAAQSSTLSVQKCVTGQDILRVEVVTSGCTTPLTLTQLQLNMTGSTIPGTNTNDVSLIHIYYTGNSATFTPTGAFDGAGTAVAAGTITVNGSQTLTSGTNYFWIAYDINNASATIGNVVDAQCLNLTVGSVRTPTVTNPAGSRTIAACAGSPGGVSTGLTVWYKADNTSSITLATGVSSWASSGGNAGAWAVTQATGSQQPTVTAGSTGVKLFNYNPRLNFVASANTFLGNGSTLTDLTTASGSYFVIADKNIDNNTGFTYSANTFSYAHQFKPGFRSQSSDASLNGWTFDFTAPTEYSNFSAGLTTVSGSGATMGAYKNSVPLAASNSNSATYTPAITTGLYMGRNNLGGEDTDADMAEIIMYNVTPTLADRNKIESYLAIKFGLTRGGNTGTTATYNYVSSNGTAIWTKTANTGYNFDIAGIGRDDASALFQKQSISVNNNEPVTVGLTSIVASNPLNANSFAADRSFLIWGNNGLLNQITANPSCFANLPAGIYGHIERVWKGQVTNFAQSVTVGFETSMLVAYLPVSNLRLLVDNDGGDWTNATIYTGAVINGSRVEFSGVTISSATPFFTLASITPLTPLPVELIDFEATLTNNRSVDLNWTTETEQNCAYFTMDRSTNGTDWEQLFTKQGHGTSVVTNTYHGIDETPTIGVNYYRLSETDFDGVTTEVGIRAVALGQEEEIMIYPNPANEFVYLSYDSNNVYEVLVVDVMGRMVWKNEVKSGESIDVREFEAGMYVLKINGKEYKLIIGAN
jgi:hypothetical protein